MIITNERNEGRLKIATHIITQILIHASIEIQIRTRPLGSSQTQVERKHTQVQTQTLRNTRSQNNNNTHYDTDATTHIRRSNHLQANGYLFSKSQLILNRSLGVIVILGETTTLETVTFWTRSHLATGLVVGRSGVSSIFV